jgi:hypothetical protein
MFLHAEMDKRGIVASGETADEYWSVIDTELSQKFPDQYGPVASGNGRQKAQPEGGQAHPPARKPVTITSGSRTPGAPEKVRLTQTQVQLAKRLGLSNEDYARQLLKEQREKANV